MSMIAMKKELAYIEPLTSTRSVHAVQYVSMNILMPSGAAQIARSFYTSPFPIINFSIVDMYELPVYT
jgi:hypothetical protein